MRLAFGEGFGYAFAGMMLDSPLMRDSIGVNQAQESFFDIESDSVVNPGWYSEASVHHILWDLYDVVPDGADNVALGFAPIWQILTGAQRTTDALTSIFSFIPPLKQANAGQAAGIDTLVSGQSIVSVTMDIFGTTETNNAGNASMLPVYTPITVGGGSRTVNSSLQFGGYNGLGVNRFLLLNAASGTSVGITVTGPAASDPDIVIWRRGLEVGRSEEVGDEPLFRQTLGALPAVLVLEVYEFDYTDDTPPAPPTNSFTPITVTVTP
jgi:hypothetical protein